MTTTLITTLTTRLPNPSPAHPTQAWRPRAPGSVEGAQANVVQWTLDLWTDEAPLTWIEVTVRRRGGQQARTSLVRIHDGHGVLVLDDVEPGDWTVGVRTGERGPSREVLEVTLEGRRAYTGVPLALATAPR